MKRKMMLFVTSLVAAGTVLVGCGENENNTTPIQDSGNDNNTEEVNDVNNTNDSNNNEATEEGSFSAWMVTDTGGVDDQSFNQSAWAGLEDFSADYPEVDVNYIQSSDAADYAPNLNRLAMDETDLAFAIGFLMEDDVRNAAEQNPDSNFAIVDVVVMNDAEETYPNIANITFAEHEGSFLAGVVAAMHTETNELGFIGGVNSPLIKKFENGFKAGVAYVDSNIEVVVQYAETFNDASVGQQIANTMYSNGADIIYHAAGGTGNGLFTEAIDRARSGESVWAIGVDQDQALIEGEWDEGNVILTSMVKRVDQAVYQVAEATMNGEYPGGEILEFTLEDNGVGIAETQDNVSQEALDAVEEIRQMIIDGEIEVPQTDDEFEEYQSGL